MTSSSDNIAVKQSTWHWGQAVLLLIILLAFMLRVHNLDGQSMWSDEGLSLYRARQSLPKLLSNIITVDGIDTYDTNPPLYFLMLHFWQRISGDSVFGLRLLGVITGTLAVPLIYSLSKEMFGDVVGLGAALLLAISPFHVWQSQVLRNYAPLLTINLLSVYSLFRSTVAQDERISWPWLLVWGLSSAVAIYIHYFSFFILAFGFLFLLFHLVRQAVVKENIPGRFRLILYLLAVFLLVLPIIPIALSRFLAGQQIDFYQVPVLSIIVHALSAYAVGMHPSLRQPWERIWPSVMLMFLGLWWIWRRKRMAAVFLLGYQLVPLGLLILASVYNPLYNGTRHLLIGLPPFLIFLSVGGVKAFEFAVHRFHNLFTRLSMAAICIGLSLLVIIIQANWLHEQFTSPRLVRDDVRGFAQYMTHAASARDSVVLHDTILKFTFDEYYDGSAPVIAIPSYGESNLGGAIAALETVGQTSEVVWFLVDPKPRTGFHRDHLVDWADAHWLRVYERSFPAMWLHMRLRAYQPSALAGSLPDTASSINVSWSEHLRLSGYTIPETIVPGMDLWFALYWSHTGGTDYQHTVSLQLWDDKGEPWQLMDEGLENRSVPGDWHRDGLMVTHHRVTVPAELPSGSYRVSLHIADVAKDDPVFLQDLILHVDD